MPTGEKQTTVKELAKDSGLNQEQVREVVRALAQHGIVIVEEPGDRVVAAIQGGVATAATPTTSVEDVVPEPHTRIKPEVGEELSLPHDVGDTKG